jgi:short-subunit dehydrogenase
MTQDVPHTSEDARAQVVVARGSDAAARRPGALIVGASSGIGEALAQTLAARGYRVALVARRADRLEMLRQQIDAAHGSGRAQVYPFDVRDYDAAPELFARIQSDLDTESELRVVVYVSGVMPDGGQGTWTFDDEREMIETNVLGALCWLGLAVPVLKSRRGSALLGISSVAGDRGRRGNSAYMASKAALSTYLESLRYRLRGSGVRVVTIKPGWVETAMLAGARYPKPLVTSPEAVARRVARACERGPEVVYIPGFWRPITALLRHLPAPLMARLPV